jgi:hypothetical protein
MGSWSVSCGISNIAITSGNECCIIPLIESHSEYGGYVPVSLPIFGRYNDYGGMEDIVENENTKLIENYVGISISELVEFLVDGKFTYNRSEVNPIREKLDANGRLNEVEKWRFMWVDKQVYDFMSISYDKWEKGHHDFGTPEMLALLGFTLVEDAEIKNYDPERFDKKYQRGNLFVYSDGQTMLSEKNQYIYYTDKGCESSLMTYIELPEDLLYIKDKVSHEIWRLFSPKKIKERFNYLFGGDRYAFHDDDTFINLIIERFKREGKEIPPDLDLKQKPQKIYQQYFENMEVFGDLLVGMLNVRHNLHPMSGRWFPHALYLTPQCGEYDHHQILLDGFAKINKSYIYNEDEE